MDSKRLKDYPKGQGFNIDISSVQELLVASGTSLQTFMQSFYSGQPVPFDGGVDLVEHAWQQGYITPNPPLKNPNMENQLLIDARVFPSEERTITALKTDDKFEGAHNYYIQPMVQYQDGAVYAKEPEAAIEIRFVKRNEDGTWQPGVQTEQLLLMLADRHEKLNAVFPAEGMDHTNFMCGIKMALDALGNRVRERQARGVMGELKK